MGIMNLGPDRFWSDGTADFIDEYLEKHYGLTDKLTDAIFDNDPKALKKAEQIYSKASKNKDFMEGFFDAAVDETDGDYRPRVGDFKYGLKFSLGLGASPIADAILHSEKKKSKTKKTKPKKSKAKKTKR